MERFEVLVRGDNCLVQFGSSPAKHGFFAGRYVKAPDIHQAERLAIDSVKDELSDILLNHPTDPPSVYAEEIRRLKFLERYRGSKNGFTWFSEVGKPDLGQP